MSLRFLGIATGLSLLACGSNPAGEATQDEDGPIDPSRDPARTVRIETTPYQVAPGTESLTCEFLEPLDRDLVVEGFGARQSSGGHHMVLFRSIVPVAPGTVADCTTAESMSNVLPALINMVTAEPGIIEMEFPEGMAVVLPKGTQLVVQSHYLNPTNAPLMVHDKMDVWLSDRDASELTPLHLFIVTAPNPVIPAATRSHSIKAGCTLNGDIQALSLGAHMHEHGDRISLDIGPPGALQRIVETTGWQPRMRDAAPIISFVENGKPTEAGLFRAGEEVEATCTWNNPGATEITFPNEMCAYSGYYVSQDPAAADIFCTDTR